MITLYPYENLGRFNAGWLDAHYHFSFSHYHNPDRMGFGPLRVINDDIVKAGGGFDPHPHDNMEITLMCAKGRSPTATASAMRAARGRATCR